MRVLRCISTGNPAQGGPWTGLSTSAALHAAQGHVTEVVTFDSPNEPWIAASPVKVHALGPGFLTNKFCAAYRPWLQKHARDYDAIFVHGLWNYVSRASHATLHEMGVPYSVFLHGSLDPWFKTVGIKGWSKSLYYKLVEQRVLTDAFAVIFTAEEERRLALEAFPSQPYNGRVVAYGVASPPPASEDQRTAFAAKVPALAERKYILFLSRIHEKKGCDLLVSAFGALAEKYPDVDLVIAGPDQSGLIPKLKREAEEDGFGHRLHWPGPLSGDAKWGAFHGCEAFVLPSHTENFGLAIVEAMACGAPVLITDKVNIWTEVERYCAGIVRSDTLAGTTDALDTFLRMNNQERQAMGASALTAFAERFEAHAAAADLLKLCEEMRHVRGS